MDGITLISRPTLSWWHWVHTHPLPLTSSARWHELGVGSVFSLGKDSPGWESVFVFLRHPSLHLSHLAIKVGHPLFSAGVVATTLHQLICCSSSREEEKVIWLLKPTVYFSPLQRASGIKVIAYAMLPASWTPRGRCRGCLRAGLILLLEVQAGHVFTGWLSSPCSGLSYSDGWITRSVIYLLFIYGSSACFALYPSWAYLSVEG